MTLAAVAMGAQVVGGFVSAIGAMQSANAQAQASEYNASIAERNKILADQDRQRNIETARIAAEDKARENRRLLSTIRNNYGSTGLELAGSPIDALADSSIEMALDVRRIEHEGQVKGREGALRMLGLQEEATMARAAAKNQRASGRMAAMSSLIGGAGGAASTGAQYYG